MVQVLGSLQSSTGIFVFDKNSQNPRWLMTGIHLKRSVRLGDGCCGGAWVVQETISAYILELEIRIMETLQRFLVFMLVCFYQDALMLSFPFLLIWVETAASHLIAFWDSVSHFLDMSLIFWLWERK